MQLDERTLAEVESKETVLGAPQVTADNIAWLALCRDVLDGFPSSVCLCCFPAWEQVNRLALQDYRWQVEKEKAIEAGAFERACFLMSEQDELRPRLIELVRELLLGKTE